MFQLDKKHQKYEKYNPTNIDWIGDIPDGWGVKKLKYFSKLISDGDWVESKDQVDIEKGDFKLLQLKNIGEGNLIKEVDKAVVQDFFRASNGRKIEIGDLLIARIPAPILRNFVFSQKHQERFGNCISVVDATILTLDTKKVKPNYISYAFHSDGVRKYGETLLNGSTRQRITRTDIESISFILPPFQIQQKITTFLDEKTALLDEAIAKKNKQIELLSEHRTALINDAITKGLDKNVEMKDSGIEWIGKIPKEWKVKKIKYWSSNKANKTEFNSDSFTVALENIESWTGGYITLEENKIFEGDMNIFKSGDVLFGKLRPYLAKVYKTTCEGLCVGEFLVLRPTKNILQNFLYYRLISSDFIDQVNNSTFGAKMPRADWDFIGNSKIPIPSIEEQKEIADYLDKETKYIDDMIAKIEKSIELLEEYKTSLISHAVSGKIRVS